MQPQDLSEMVTNTGAVERIWLIEIQAAPEDVDKIIDSMMKVDPLIYGRYKRNAFVSAIGIETYV
ncbi:MAG: hypothetical protein ACKVH7_04610, partial [Alphaproteobacteria bacterium]